MKRLWAFSAALFLLLTACGAETPSPLPSPASESCEVWGETPPTPAVVPSEPVQTVPKADATVTPEPAMSLSEADAERIPPDGITEDGIFSYLQGVKSYEKGLSWTGDWCYIDAGGGKLFSSFGCGLCCLANMFSTLTDTPCDPGQMYQMAKEQSGYSPGPGGGAIGWEDISRLCEIGGFPGTLCRKPADYAEFQRDMASSRTLLVLVSSDNDDTVWQNVLGHYVNLWLYDEADDTVFLTDSRGPKNNRRRIPLEDVYRALCTSDAYQYLLVP